jgi:hydrogenase-4 component B
LSIVPLYFIAFIILLIGVFPFIFSSSLLKITGLFLVNTESLPLPQLIENFQRLTVVGLYSLGFLILTAIVLFIRWTITTRLTLQKDSTWGCGYVGEVEKAQYTASSFIRTYRKLAEPVLFIKKDKKVAVGIYPNSIEQVTHPYDIIEHLLIDKPIHLFKRILNRFVFLQNGNIQYYILYGFIFIIATIVIPLLISKIMALINSFNQF